MSKYDPSIKALVDQSDEQWGSQEKNRELLTPYGIEQLDLVTYGINTIKGEFILLQGEEKNRKTTFWLNVLVNIFMGPIGPYGEKKMRPYFRKPFTVVDVLESGIDALTTKDLLIANVASRYLIANGHAPYGPCRECGAPSCRELHLSPKFLMFVNRSKQQAQAINFAREEVGSWDLHIYGPSDFEGDTRNLTKSIDRWNRLIEEKDAKLFITDHLQQYDQGTSDYEILMNSVRGISNFVSKKKRAIIAVSQVSLTSIRNRESGGKLDSSGGRKAAQEANTVLVTEYTSGQPSLKIRIDRARFARNITVTQGIEEESGAFYDGQYEIETED